MELMDTDFETLYAARYQPPIQLQRRPINSNEYGQYVFSLQDTCKLYILCTIDEYPINQLAKLPLRMRKMLFMAMPVFDRLYFDGTAFLDGLQVLDYIPLLYKGENYLSPSSSLALDVPANSVYMCSWLRIDQLKQALADVLFSRKPYDLNEYGALNFLDGVRVESFDCMSYLYDDNPPADLNLHMFYAIKSRAELMACKTTERCRLLSLAFPRMAHLNYAEGMVTTMVVPSRLVIRHTLSNFEKYCRTLARLRLWDWNVRITTTDFYHCSRVWEYFMTARSEKIGKAAVLKTPLLQCNDFEYFAPIYPCLQIAFSSIKHLTIEHRYDSIQHALDKNNEAVVKMYNSTGEDLTAHWVSGAENNTTIVIPYLVMCNISTNARSQLQTIIIDSESIEKLIKTFLIIAHFLCGDREQYLLRYLETDQFLLPAEPYLINTLVIKLSDRYQRCQKNSMYLIFNVLQNIIEKQMLNLRSVMCLVCSDNRSVAPGVKLFVRLLATLTEFVKQPQFEHLILGELPESHCYELVTAFITTPAKHNQELRVNLRNCTAKGCDFNHQGHKLPSFEGVHLSSTNKAFKSLDLGVYEYPLIRQVVGLPQLKFKKLRIPMGCLAAIIEKQTICDISHVIFEVNSAVNSGKYSLRQLEWFVKSNRSLSVIEFNDRLGDRNEPKGNIAFFKTINLCLEMLVSRNEVVTNSAVVEIGLHCQPFHHYLELVHENIEHFETFFKLIRRLHQISLHVSIFNPQPIVDPRQLGHLNIHTDVIISMLTKSVQTSGTSKIKKLTLEKNGCVMYDIFVARDMLSQIAEKVYDAYH